jgi:hypothetical protein
MVGKMEAYVMHLKAGDKAMAALSSNVKRNPKCGSGSKKRSTKYVHPLKGRQIRD